MPQNHHNKYKMEKRTNNRKGKVRGKSKKRFLAVDVWRTHFGPVSVRAIFDVYSQKFNVETYNMKNYSFSDCLNSLRKLEDPNYKQSEYKSHR